MFHILNTSMADINIVVALTKNAKINITNLSWLCPEHFHKMIKLTKDSIVVMGRNTWESLPEGYDDFDDRKNIVVTTRSAAFSPQKNTMFVSPKDIDKYIVTNKPVFVIGGASLFAMFIQRAQHIYATILEADRIELEETSERIEEFPLKEFMNFKIVEFYPVSGNGKFRHVTYERIRNGQYNHDEFQYLDLLRDIYENGKSRDDRTKIGTRAVFGRQIRFNIADSVPLITTKHVGWKSVVKELLWFIKGETDSKTLEQQGVNIWKSNSTREFLDNRGLHHYSEGDIGPMYGFNWRHLGARYNGTAHEYSGNGFDQLQWLIHSLKTDPYSRRHMITTFNPLVVDQGVLAPCHGIVTQFFVEDDIDSSSSIKHLSCHVYNRSQDTFLGMTWNIFSYAVFTHIVAKFTGMKPKELVISTGDTHIYTNHLEQCKMQLSRTPLPFPRLVINDRVVDKGIDNITIDDFDLIGYMCHSAIKAPMAV